MSTIESVSHEQRTFPPPREFAAQANVKKADFDATMALHPTAAGHADYAAHLYNEHLKNLLPASPAPTPPAPQFFVADRNSSGNSYSNPTGTETVHSVAGSNGWLVGCAPAGGVSCPTPSDRAVEEVVAKVSSNTTVKAAGLWITMNPRFDP